MSNTSWRRVAETAMRVLVVFDAATFILAAILHLGVRIPLGAMVLAEPPIIPATIVEGLCGLFLAVSAYALFARRSWAWTSASAAHVFALAGVLLGMFSLAMGFGPSTVINDIYHRTMLVMLIGGLVLLLTYATTGTRLQSSQSARWLALIGGVANPIAFVLIYTVAGMLRPGYSPIHQAISDLGVGLNGSLMDAIDVVHALLLIVFAVGFAIGMRPVLSRRWLGFGVMFLVLRGLAGVITGIFTEAPTTVAIHSLAALVSLISMMSAFLLIGLGLRRDPKWRGWGTYSLIAALVTLVLVAVLFWVFRPDTPLAPLQLGGLMERVVSVETLAWYVAFGWRLFAFTGSQRTDAPSVAHSPA